MEIGRTAILVYATLVASVTCLELVANYKFWDSSSEEILYDYSGNSKHGTMPNAYHVLSTDRGYTTISGTMLTTFTQGYSDFAISFWALKFSGFSIISYYIFDGVTFGYNIQYYLSDSATEIYYINYGSIIASNTNLPPILGWNLFTIRLYNSTPSQTSIYLYNKLSTLHFFNTILQNSKSFDLSFFNIIFHELWAHAELSSINDLNHLLFNGCPTSPTDSCLPNWDYTRNKEGEKCPVECTSKNLSCDSSLFCIQPGKSSCLYGLYHIESNNCIFFCPESSCDCSSNFDCSCKEGYKKISDVFVGCVPDYWVEYHKEGYIYVIDKFEEGISLDSNGNCCICEEDYITVSTQPLACVYMPNCLTYIEDGENYLCSECIEEYKLNSEGQCLECSEGYDKISGVEGCTRIIESCLEYIEIEDSWICNKCKVGYLVSSSGQCDECQEGYLKVQGSSIICLEEIVNCIEYDISLEESRCIDCREGYMLDSYNNCSSCDYNYVEVSNNPLECAYKVARCASYDLYLSEWVCNSCEQGYKLDNQLKCTLCADGYNSISEEVLECVLSNETISDSGDSSNNSDNQDDSNDDEEVITQVQKERAEIIKSANTATTSTVMASTSVSGVVSMNPTTLIFYLNTIQLLSFILYLNVKLPFEIKQEQSSTRKLMKKLNILSYIKLEDKNPKEYTAQYLDDDNGFISNMIYQLLILSFIFILNTLFYCLNKYGKGKIKDIAVKVLKIFNYTIYIQFIMLTYIDFADSALIKILNVRYI